MKNRTFFLIFILGMTFFSFMRLNDDPDRQSNRAGFPNNISAVTSKKLDANNISTWFRNNGSFNRDPSTGNAGFEWPKGSSKFARYSSGLWLGAKVGGDTLIAQVEYSYEFLPGYIDNSGMPQGSENPLYRVYRIERGDTTSEDYLNWPVDQGAFVNSEGKPFFLGTQTMFYSSTDGYAAAHKTSGGSTAPMKAVVLQTNWSYTNAGLQDVVFSDYKIINRSNETWENAYISFWTDDDLGGPLDDATAVDSILNLTYTYNFDNDDEVYGTAPPAVGFLILQGPAVPSVNDTARYYDPPGSNNFVEKINYKLLNISSSNMFMNGNPITGDPVSYIQTYSNMQGLKRDGSQWISPINSQPSKFPFSGDPVTSSGWLQTSGSDRRSLVTIGPLNMNAQDTQSVIIAQLIARGQNNLASVTALKALAGLVKSIYEGNFQDVLEVRNLSTEIPDGYSLQQNFPNPFNPSTVIRYSITGNSLVTLKVYDVLGNEVSTLVNQKQNAGSYEVEFNGLNLSSGIYFYRINTDRFTDTKRMILVK